jgi:spectinomycin phosphotransferase
MCRECSRLLRILRLTWFPVASTRIGGLDVVEVTYAPVGHGSHNWIAVADDGTKWFVKAYRSGPNSGFFQATYQTAAALVDAGLDFVSGPIRDLTGKTLSQVAQGWEISVLPFIDGRNPDFSSDERVQVAEILGRLHAFTPLPDVAPRWKPGWLQPELKQVLAGELDRRWAEGPYGERARALFMSSRDGIERLLARSEDLAARLADSGDPFVVTHGEPHDSNTMIGSAGTIHLVDCDAMMAAPRERDLRLLLHASHRRARDLDNTQVIAAYRRSAGRVEARPFVLELFRAEWHLIEMARYARLFSGPHRQTADVQSNWKSLNGYLPVSQNWLGLTSV